MTKAQRTELLAILSKAQELEPALQREFYECALELLEKARSKGLDAA